MNFLHTYLLLVGATYCCTATLTVDLELILYNIPQHRDCAGIICDSTSDCDNFFDFCVRAAGNETCLSPMLRTGDLENDLITFSADDLTDLGITNPIQFSSIYTNSRLEFFVKITDDDGSGTDDEIDEIIIPLGAHLQANSEFGPNVTYYGACGRAYIQVQTRITSECPTNRYGPDCTKVCEEVPGRKVCNYLGDPSCLENYYYPEGTCETYCKPRNDVSGHYHCSEKGEIMCLDGYIDPSTNCITCRGNFKEPDCNECDDHFEKLDLSPRARFPDCACV